MQLALKPKESQLLVIGLAGKRLHSSHPATGEELVVIRFTEVARAAPGVGMALPVFVSWTVQKWVMHTQHGSCLFAMAMTSPAALGS